jgi:acetyl-CoA acetyltransferase
MLIVDAAALQRVPEIKSEDVQEVFFGNVLSAKLALCFMPTYNIRLTRDF